MIFNNSCRLDVSINKNYSILQLISFFILCFVLIFSLFLVYCHSTTSWLKVRTFHSFILNSIGGFGFFCHVALGEGINFNYGKLSSCPLSFSLAMVALVGNTSFVLFRQIIYYRNYKLFKTVSVHATNHIRSSNVDLPFQITIKSKSTNEAKLKTLFKNVTPKAVNILFFKFLLIILISPIIVSFIFCPNNITKNESCPLEGAIVPILAGSNIFVVGIIYFIIYYLTKDYPDPFKIMHEHQFLYILHVSLILVYVLSYVFTYIGNENEIRFSPAYLTTLIVFAMLIYTMPYQVYKARNHNIITSLTLEDILNNESASQLFMMHLISERSEENLEFYQQVVNFKQNFNEYSFEAKVNVANNIYRRYLNENTAKYSLNISWQMRDEIKTSLDNKALNLNTFDKASEEVFKLMEHDSFFRFKESTFYNLFVGLVGEEAMLHLHDINSLL